MVLKRDAGKERIEYLLVHAKGSHGVLIILGGLMNDLVDCHKYQRIESFLHGRL